MVGGCCTPSHDSWSRGHVEGSASVGSEIARASARVCFAKRAFCLGYLSLCAQGNACARGRVSGSGDYRESGSVVGYANVSDGGGCGNGSGDGFHWSPRSLPRSSYVTPIVTWDRASFWKLCVASSFHADL